MGPPKGLSLDAPLRIDMNSLPVVGMFGEAVDRLLGHVDPLALS